MRDRTDLGQEGKGSVKCFCKSGNEFSGSVLGKKFLDQSKEYHEIPNLFSLTIAGYLTAVHQV
jgi:hypothetical protein